MLDPSSNFLQTLACEWREYLDRRVEARILQPSPRCNGKIRSDSRYLTCSVIGCNNSCHQKCTDQLSRPAIEVYLTKGGWICETCAHPISLNDPTPALDTADTNEAKGKKLQRPIRFMQWNCEGINTKVTELTNYLSVNSIDVAMLQETKLTACKATPNIRGYAVLRADRKGAENPGGGLVTLIKDNLGFKNHGPARRGAMETQSFSIQQTAKKWINLINIYCPPDSKKRPADLDMAWLPANSNTIYAGDLNAHSRLWDNTQRPDERGTTVEDWLIDNGLHCLNDGAHTRNNRASAGESTPDVTISSQDISSKIKWHVDHNAMGSDHLPIILELNNGTTRLVNNQAKPSKWKSKHVDWTPFTEEVEKSLPLSEGLNIDQKVKQFNSILIDAGYRHVGKTKPKRNNLCLTPAVKTAIKKRNILRKDLNAASRQEWLDACQEARRLTEESKVDHWVEFLDELEEERDHSKTWRMIRSLDGTPNSMAPNEALLVNNKDITSDMKKADAFGRHYAGVSKLSFTKEERDRNRLLKKKMREKEQEHQKTSTSEEGCTPITMEEMTDSIKKMKGKGAPGPDDIPPNFLKNLGEKGKIALLDIFNMSTR